jgi:hypothetical protein
MFEYLMTVKHNGGEWNCQVPEKDFLAAVASAEEMFWNANLGGEIVSVKGSLVRV